MEDATNIRTQTICKTRAKSMLKFYRNDGYGFCRQVVTQVQNFLKTQDLNPISLKCFGGASGKLPKPPLVRRKSSFVQVMAFFFLEPWLRHCWKVQSMVFQNHSKKFFLEIREFEKNRHGEKNLESNNISIIKFETNERLNQLTNQPINMKMHFKNSKYFLQKIMMEGYFYFSFNFSCLR